MISDLYRLRENLEDLNSGQLGGLNAILTGVGFQVFTRINAIGEFYKITPRVELKAEIGEATGHRFMCPDNVLRFDYFNFNLAIQCVTRPKNKPANNELHEVYVSTVRAAMSAIGGNESLRDHVNFPSVFIAEFLKDSGTADYLKESDGLEYTTLSYAGIVGIRQTAWSNN